MPKYVYKNRNTDVAGSALLWVAMLPLLCLETLRLRVQCGTLQSAFLQVQYVSSSPYGGPVEVFRSK